jgi:hypothetical protein
MFGYKQRIVSNGDRSWGHRPIFRWIIAGLLVLLAGYIGYTLFKSTSDVGDWCESNANCGSKMCLKERGRHLQYCTVRCEEDAECPEGWKCLRSPDLADRWVCIRPGQ